MQFPFFRPSFEYKPGPGPEMPEHFKKNSINCEKSVTDATEISQFTDLKLAL
jgi:hypothetical protein